MLLIELFAEREGFEPPVPLGTVVFKTTVIDHSTISPVFRIEQIFRQLFAYPNKNNYLCSVIYPNNFEHKLGFDEIRRLLKERCFSTLGKEKVDEMAFSADGDEVNERLTQVREFRRLKEEKDDFPMQYFFDVREAVTRIRMEGTHLEEDEV